MVDGGTMLSACERKVPKCDTAALPFSPSNVNHVLTYCEDVQALAQVSTLIRLQGTRPDLSRLIIGTIRLVGSTANAVFSEVASSVQ
jgi:hypothetical protein